MKEIEEWRNMVEQLVQQNLTAAKDKTFKVMLFLQALPSTFNGVAQVKLSIKEDMSKISLDNIISAVMQEQAHCKSTGAEANRTSTVEKYKKYCEKCGHNNHNTNKHQDDLGKRRKNLSKDAKDNTSNGNNRGDKEGKHRRKKKDDKDNSTNASASKATVNVDDISATCAGTLKLNTISYYFGVTYEIHTKLVDIEDYWTETIAHTSSPSIPARTGPQEWIIDSGASVHITPHIGNFSQYQEFKKPIPVTTADGNTSGLLGWGIVYIANGPYTHEVKQVYYWPQAKERLLSPQLLVRKENIWWILDNNSMLLYMDDIEDPILIAPHEPACQMFILKGKIKRRNHANNAQAQGNYNLWHSRFGHAGKRALLKAPGSTKGMPKIKEPTSTTPCEGCKLGKLHRTTFKSLPGCSKNVLDLIHSDLDTMEAESIDGYKYTVTFLDDASSFGIMFYLKKKSKTLDRFKDFKAWAENQTEQTIKTFRSNRGGEFFNREFDKYLATNGIERQQSVPKTPQQNG
jgi:hypothetical protein